MEMIRGIIESVQATAGKVRRFTASGRVGEKFRNALLFGMSGITSKPKVGTRVIILQSGNLVAGIAEDNPDDRPDLDALEGAVAVHSDADHYVLIKNDGSVVIKTDQPVTIESATIRLGSDSVLALKKLVTSDLLPQLQAHVHPGGTLPSGSTGPSVTPFVDLVLDSLYTTSKVKAE